MKLLILIFIAIAADAQTKPVVVPASVVVTIQVDAKTYTVALTDAAREALARVVAKSNSDDIGILMMDFVANNLVKNAINTYQTSATVQAAVAASQAAQVAAVQAKAGIDDALNAASRGTVTVK